MLSPSLAPVIPGIDWHKPCAACPRTCALVPGDGAIPPPNPGCRILAIGERPGQDEYKRSGRPFTGKSGQELNENYLLLAGLTRDDIYLCNTVRCGDPANRTPGKRETEACARHFLPYELDAIRPHYILLLGGIACSLFDDDPLGPVNLQLHHGRPLRRSLYGHEYWVIPMYHPALGMHDTRKMTPILEDWETAGRIIQGEYRIPQDPYKGKTDYRLVDAEGVRAYFARYRQTTGVNYGGFDTETDEGRLWCATVSIAPGTGIMVRADDLDGLAELWAQMLHGYHWFIHNAPFDLEKVAIFTPLPLHLPPTAYSCTQQAAYHRGNLPQGLKALGWRLFGVQMTDYEDVVMPHSRNRLMEWWVDALLLTGEEQVEIPGKVSLKTGRQGKSRFKPTPAYSRLLQIYNHTPTSADLYYPWKKWDEAGSGGDGAGKLTRADKDRITAVIGPPPRPSIIHVPTDAVVDYAVRDCDVGLRLGLHFHRDETQLRKRIGLHA